MTGWLNAIGAAIPIVLMLGAMIWALIVFHGDSRWLKRPEAVDTSGEMRWPAKDIVQRLDNLVLGQNDSIADHENRLGRLEEREETVLKEIRTHLSSLSDKMDDVRDRVTRLEARADTRRHTDSGEA